MRKKKYTFTVLALILAALLLGFSGCSNPFQTGPTEDSGQTRTEPDTGNLTVAFGAELARTSLLPDFSGLLQSYVLTAEKDGTTISETRNDVGTTQLSGLTYGTWTVTVEGMSGADGSGDVLARGSADVVIDQASNSVNIVLEYLRAEGQGDIQLTVTVPTASGVTRITSQFAGGTETDMTITDDGVSSEVVFSKANVASGEHDLIIRFYTGEAGSYVSLGNPLVLLVHVFGNISTEKTIAVDETQLNTTPDAPVSLSATAASGGAELTWSDNSWYETGYVVERRPEGGSWTEVAQLGANAVGYLDDIGGIPADDHTRTRYQYRVYAENAIGSSAASETSVVNLLGYMHPTSGSFAPVDENGATAGFGWGGASWPLGSHFTAGGGSSAEIAVYSSAAERILLEIYGEAPAGQATADTAITEPLYDYWLEKGADDVWRAKLQDIPDGTYYTFRAWGPGWTWNDGWTRGNSAAGFTADVVNGHRFNPNKTIYDPYTRELSHDKENPFLLALGHNGGMYGTGPDTYSADGTDYGVRREFDTGIYAPKGIIIDTGAMPAVTGRPNLPQEDIIVMETHVRGLTNHDSTGDLETILSGFPYFEGVQNIPEAERGTYAGAAKMAPYLKGMGYTAIELMPLHETANDDNTEGEWSAESPGEVPGNFWGYMTYGFFAPDRRYASDKSAGGPTREFREMVNAFHAQGIEVIMDVVYNHTGEGGSWGDDTEDQQNTAEITSFKGFDNNAYYFLSGNNGEFFQNYAGTGNSMDFRNNVVQQMTLDSLTYWIDEMGASGFRFDLAYILGRTAEDQSFEGENSPMLTAIADLGSGSPAGNTAKMWAEAWDAAGGYAVGGFPSGSLVGDWAEWNDMFRDPLRDLIKDGSNDSEGTFTPAFYGSADTYDYPHKTLNFVVAHDGFTLMDLVSYNMNSAAERDAINLGLRYPWGPSDGGKDNNHSWDHGGDTGLRRQQIRNFWTLLMFAKGVPMTVYGDELNRTQNGNNNPYKIDTVATWNNYNMINTNSPHLVTTGTSGDPYDNNYGTDNGSAGQNAFFRFAQFVTRLRRDSQGLRVSDHDGDFTISAPKGDNYDYRNHAFRTSINGGGSVDDGIFLLLANTEPEAVDFDIWDPGDGYAWRRIIDTNSWAEDQQNFWEPDDTSAWQFAYRINDFSVPARTVVVFQKVAIDPADGLTVNIKTPPSDWEALSDLDVGRWDNGSWDGWYIAEDGALEYATWYSLFLYPYDTQDYSIIIRFREDGVGNEVFHDDAEASFDILNSQGEVWIDLSGLYWIEDGPPKKFWTDDVTETQPQP